jgi:hypothetical protein
MLDRAAIPARACNIDLGYSPDPRVLQGCHHEHAFGGVGGGFARRSSKRLPWCATSYTSAALAQRAAAGYNFSSLKQFLFCDVDSYSQSCIRIAL